FSSEVSTVANRPSLTVCYSDGPPADTCDDGVQSPGEVGVDCGGPCPACDCTPGETAPCYTGPAGTEGVGACAAGVQTCDADGSGYGECANEVLPAPESCATPEDDNCDGAANEGCACVPGSSSVCYTGPVGTAGVGACAVGFMTCNAGGTAYGPCTGEVVPAAESCGNTTDDDCDGQVDEGCVCTPGMLDYCYSGPPGTLGLGACQAGTHQCNATGTAWGPCNGEVLPTTESCGTAADDDCDGQVNEGCVCAPFSTQSCYTGPAGTQGVGICAAGTRTCNSTGTAWGACTGQTLPATESCANNTDDDCDGTVNENCAAATCGLYTESFDDGNAGEITSGTYKIGWCDTYLPTEQNTPLCMSGRTLRTNQSSEDPTIWVSRGNAPCTSAKITYSYYQFAQAAVTLQYQRSNDAAEVCEKTGTFTSLATIPTTQACVTQSATVAFNANSGIYFRFEHPSNTNALWIDNVSIELQGCSCN
ncbi:MAG: MopE-related protein, partial [Polyangiaceae bacterium]